MEKEEINKLDNNQIVKQAREEGKFNEINIKDDVYVAFGSEFATVYKDCENLISIPIKNKVGTQVRDAISKELMILKIYEDEKKCKFDITTKLIEITELIAKAKYADSINSDSKHLEWNFNFKIHNIEDYARAILKINPLYCDDNKIWWKWTGIKWEEVKEHHIMEFIKKTFKAQGMSSSNNRTTMLNALKDETHSRKPIIPPDTWLQCNETIIDISSGLIIEPSPKYFMKTVIPWNIGKTEETPMIDKLFCDWQDEKKDVLYDICAYSISPSSFLDIIFFLVGNGANGKGLFQEIVTKLIGVENTISQSLELLSKIDQRFQTTCLRDKLLCKLGDGNMGIIKDTKTLKEISGKSDFIRGEIKGGGTIQFKNKAKVMGAFNTLPESVDKTTGWYRRVHITEFKNTFDCKTEVLINIPDVEYENLLKRILSRLQVIYSERTVQGWGDIDERKDKYERLSNPIKVFIDTHMEENCNGYVTPTKIYQEYASFAVKKGYNTFNYNEFTTRLLNNPLIEKIRKDVYTFEDGEVFGKKTDIPIERLTDENGSQIDLRLLNDKKNVYRGYIFKNIDKIDKIDRVSKLNITHGKINLKTLSFSSILSISDPNELIAEINLSDKGHINFAEAMLKYDNVMINNLIEKGVLKDLPHGSLSLV